ncbi:tryptophan dimethylallyltransferase-domain-containing protein [Auriculariales sp. MPI-PUGE-AT-0066]|nr:tryptophan dimethylallyltransferase-domain-containing protein [Auriculariales sp. MPI-PUGE-AT-0066]
MHFSPSDLDLIVSLRGLAILCGLGIAIWLASPTNLRLVEAILLTRPRHLRRTLWWYQHVGRKFDMLFELSQHSAASRRRNLRYLLQYIIPYFGPSPPEFAKLKETIYKPIIRTPVELIWVLDGKRPMSVRWGMEVLDEHYWPAAKHRTVKSARRETTTRLGLTSVTKRCWTTTGAAHDTGLNKIQWFPGGEFGADGRITAKLYYYPARAAATGTDPFRVVTDCVSRLGLMDQWTPIVDFFSRNPHYNGTPEFIGVEGVPPASNRLKIYTRIGNNFSSLDEVVRVTTLGGTLNHPNVAETVQAFRRLWRLLYPNYKSEDNVPSIRPGERGMCIYFELAIGRKEAIPKIYIPTYRFAGTDQHVARAITAYHQLYSQGGDIEKNYEAHFNRLFVGYNLNQHMPFVHTYIGIATKKGTTQMTIYYALDAFGVAQS